MLLNLDVGGFAMGLHRETDLSLWRRMLTMNDPRRFPAVENRSAPYDGTQEPVAFCVAAWAAVEPFPGAAAYRLEIELAPPLDSVLALELKVLGDGPRFFPPLSIRPPIA